MAGLGVSGSVGPDISLVSHLLIFLAQVILGGLQAYTAIRVAQIYRNGNGKKKK